MMKIGIICMGNTRYAPYIQYYLDELLIRSDVEVKVIDWDRLHIESASSNTYVDKKNYYRRNLFDYLNYSRFVKKRIKKEQFDFLIVSGIPLLFFLEALLLSDYKERYIIDIRDYHKLRYLTNLTKLGLHAKAAFISSPGFKTWLPEKIDWKVSHNIRKVNLAERKDKLFIKKQESDIVIAYIGTIRDIEINTRLVMGLKDSSKVVVKYHGLFPQVEKFSMFLNKNEITNVILTGKYLPGTEEELYADADLINIILPNDKINSQTLLPNRFYFALVYGIPIITLKGTYFSSLICKYNLGLVIDSFESIEMQIMNYLDAFNAEMYKTGRMNVLDSIHTDYEEFSSILQNL